MKVLTKKEIVNSFKIIILALVLSLGISQLTAWTGPQSTPPNCTSGQAGCDAPIHVGLSGQIKSGGLTVGQDLTGGISQVGLYVRNGRVAIGNLEDLTGQATLDVGGKIRIRGGGDGPVLPGQEYNSVSEGAVLTAVGNGGLAEWRLPASGSGGSGGGVSGSGTANQVPMFSGSASLANTNIYYNQSKVGIGSIFNNTQSGQQPSDTLDINGTIRIRGGGAKSGDALVANGTGGQATWEPMAVLCSNSSNTVPCDSAEANNGTGDGSWRAVNCINTVGEGAPTLAGTLLHYTNGQWQWWNFGAGYKNCNGDVLVMRIGSL